MRNFLPAEIGLHLLDEPLPHDLYNRQGVLIAREGSIIRDRNRLAQLGTLQLLRPSQEDDTSQASPYQALGEIARQYDALLDTSDGLDIKALVLLANALRQLALNHTELSIGMANLLDMPSLARRHSLHVAAVGVLLAKEMGLDESAQLTLASAALTMNLASHTLQDRLALGLDTPGSEVHAQLRMHAWHSAETLAGLGVSDARWLMTVSQHHENLDGSGHPFGVSGGAIIMEARILHVADVWCALLSHRHGRICRYPRNALKEIFRRERGRLDDAAMLGLRRLMGYYPPGTLVRLANRETALVTRWFQQRNRPQYVISLLRPSGNPVAHYQIRDTGRADYAIRDYTYLPLFHNHGLDWSKAWAAG